MREAIGQIIVLIILVIIGIPSTMLMTSHPTVILTLLGAVLLTGCAFKIQLISFMSSMPRQGTMAKAVEGVFGILIAIVFTGTIGRLGVMGVSAIRKLT